MLLLASLLDMVSTFLTKSAPPPTETGCCNGLFCAEVETPSDENGRHFLIWNPITRENRYVKKPKFNASRTPQIIALAFGFSHKTMSSVSNPQSASWTAFGLVPGLPNGGLDSLHSLGLQRTLRAPINPSMNMGMPHQRCRDFEECGFCLRGDMCPMEHGINRIVIEDVQVCQDMIPIISSCSPSVDVFECFLD